MELIQEIILFILRNKFSVFSMVQILHIDYYRRIPGGTL